MLDRADRADAAASGDRGARAAALRARGLAAMRRAGSEITTGDPFAPLFVRHGGVSAGSSRTILETWQQQTVTASGRRYHWSLGVEGRPASAAYDGPPTLWRPREAEWLEREPTAYGQRLSAPLATVTALEFLSALSRGDDPALAADAQALLDESIPIAEDDLARYIGGGDVWRDTFALWVHARSDVVREAMGTLLLALAARYGARARRTDGLVQDNGYAFRDEPLVSASAHLGSALMATGLYPSLVPTLLGYVESRRRADGGWADAEQPTDVLTTLAAAEFASGVDPTFDPGRTVDFLAVRQEAAGWWRALGPEVPWLTVAVCEWLESLERPFAERFRWPQVPRWTRDRKTSLPPYGYFSDLARLFGEVPALASAPVQLAFLDLARFKRFNDQAGQEEGDRLLRTFARELTQVGGARVIRDGGDEFLVVGAPAREDLTADLDAFRRSWPQAVEAEFGRDVPPVVPRILVVRTDGRGLKRARERLGREVGLAKDRLEVGPEGLLLEIA